MHNATKPTPVYNDNQGCIDWSKSTSIKNLRHFKIRENAVREAVQQKENDLKHHPGIHNPADMFTEEHKDKSHFDALQECLVVYHVGGGVELSRIDIRESYRFPASPFLVSFSHALLEPQIPIN
jgi:hypothetical protein